MIKFYKNLMRAIVALSCLYAPNILADVSGSPATILVEATKTVMGVGETNNIYVTVSNPTGSPISGIVVSVALPAGFTVDSTVVPSGTSFPSPFTTWTFNSSLAANSSRTLIIRTDPYMGASGIIVTPTATFTAGSTGSSDIDILIGCTFINWGGNTPVKINNRAIVQFNNANILYGENLAPQGVDAVFNGFRKNTPPDGTPQYTARFQNLDITNLGWILQFNNANPQNDPSGNSPYTIVDLAGVVDPMKLTDNPPNYLEGKFTFEVAAYPNGLAGISFFIYDIDSEPTDGWQDAVIVYGTDLDGNQVAPITQFSAITTVYDINAMVSPLILPYALSIGGKCVGGATGLNCLVGYDSDNPRGRVTYTFPQFIRSFNIRYFRNSQVDSQHFVWLSNLYRGCGTVLDLNLTVSDEIVCEECFTFTVIAENEGPSDVLLALVSGVVPEGLTVQTYTASQGTFDPETGEWQIGSLMVGQTETLVVEVCSTLSSISWDLLLLGDGDSDQVQKTISVTYAKALDDMASTLENTAVIIDWASNDYSVGGTLDLFSFNFTPPSVLEGVVTVPNPGSGLCTFTPANGFTGTVSIPYTVTDSNGCVASATIHVMVDQEVITGPTALNDSAITPLNTPVNISVLLNDLTGSAPLDPATVTIISNPSNGIITNVNPLNGVITYLPDSGFLGTDSFVYQVCDTNGLCSQATVYVTVVDPNAPCPNICPEECCGGCFNKVNECLCTPDHLLNLCKHRVHGLKLVIM
ncbi:MAG: Ig-like domain-containing protein [Candidatus Babeliales bacterium]